MFIIDVVHDAGMRLEGVDLNLLVVLDALLTEPTVTRAARRLGLSQSATSHGLARLRHLLHDPVLVRTPQGMVPTERARALAPEVRAILQQTERALRPLPAFDPSTHSATFRLGLDDATQAGVLPQLAAAFASRAPQMRIVTEATPPAELGEALASGRLDAAISLAPDTRRGVHREPLLRYRSVCLVRRGHPQLAERLTLAGYLAAGHVVIATPGSSDADVERALDRRRRVRRVVVSTSSPLAVPGIVSRTDLIATVPDRILLVRHGELVPDEVLAMVHDVARALDAAHQHGVVHRDLKPANVFRTLVDGAPSWRVLDFGIALLRQSDRRITTEQQVGTLGYMAPEQCIEGATVDQRADVYALAVVALECLTLFNPVMTNLDRALGRWSPDAVARTNEALGELPRGVAQALRRAMSEDPAQRFDDCLALHDALCAAFAAEADWERAVDASEFEALPTVSRRLRGHVSTVTV